MLSSSYLPPWLFPSRLNRLTPTDISSPCDQLISITATKKEIIILAVGGKITREDTRERENELREDCVKEKRMKTSNC